MALQLRMYGVWSLMVLVVLWGSSADGAAVISIDLGSEWLKIGIVSPGVPMEIVLNKESKRKTPAVVAFRDGVRTFGEDAVSVGVRFPKNSYKYLLDLLGKPYDHPLVQAYKERFPYYEIVESERGTPEFVHDENTRFTPEELVAQFFAKAKDFAEINHGQQISECVVTVPGYFNQAERRAVREAAALAGLSVLQLINDYTAIAINYGIFRRKEINETPWQALFFDMGAGSTKAALVEYRSVRSKEGGHKDLTPQLQVLGVAYDRTLGGLEITLRLREHLIGAWEAAGGGDVRQSPRAMEKLLREAERVKLVLSANTEHYAQVEGLLDDRDFKHLVSRAELEAWCAELWPRVADVLTRAAALGGASTDARLVVAGGGARVPAVLAALQAQGLEPSRSINADEAAAMGAVYRAAALATGYKVAPLAVRDAVLFPVQVLFQRTVDGQDKLIKRTLFGPMNPYPQKKVITFNRHTDDFGFRVNYAELDHLPPAELALVGALNLSRVQLGGVGAALRKHAGDHVDHKGVKAHFHMDDSGLLHLVNVELVAERVVVDADADGTLAKLGSTIGKLFGADADEAEGDKADAARNDTAADPRNATEPGAGAEPRVVVLKEPVEAREEALGLRPLTAAQLEASRAKLAALDAADRRRAAREAALNTLEAFVVDAQMKLDTDEYASCGTPQRLDEARRLCAATSEWLYDDGYEAPTELYEERLRLLKEKTDPIFSKHWEHRERPDAVAALRAMLNSSSAFLRSARNLTAAADPSRDVFTAVELAALETKIDDTAGWLARALAEQDALARHDEPRLTVDGVRDKMAALDREVNYLVNKMKIWRPRRPEKTAGGEEGKTVGGEEGKTVGGEEGKTAGGEEGKTAGGEEEEKTGGGEEEEKTGGGEEEEKTGGGEEEEKTAGGEEEEKTGGGEEEEKTGGGEEEEKTAGGEEEEKTGGGEEEEKTGGGEEEEKTAGGEEEEKTGGGEEEEKTSGGEEEKTGGGEEEEKTSGGEEEKTGGGEEEEKTSGGEEEKTGGDDGPTAAADGAGDAAAEGPRPDEHSEL